MNSELNIPELRTIIEGASTEESELLLIPFRKDCWIALLDAAELRTNDSLEDGARSAPPSPTLEKLAQEIDDIYEAPSRIRPLRHILEREFGARQSVAEVAKEIIEALSFGGNHAEVTRQIESILSRFREHELRELREECGRLRNTLTTVKELLPTRERALFRDDNSSTPVGVHTISESKVIRICTAIDAAMQPSAQSK